MMWLLWSLWCLVAMTETLELVQLPVIVQMEEDHVSSLVHRVRRESRPQSSLTEAEEEEVLNIHNSFRRLEPASNMEFMTWNDELGSIAQEWAELCDFEHGTPKRPKSEMPYSPVGQNLFFTTGKLNITVAITVFYKEKDNYEYENRNCFQKICGHYTQVVWGASREVGCGIHRCDVLTESSTNKSWSNAAYLVCQYGPTGNVAKEFIYSLGDPCTECPSGKNWCDTHQPRGLCRRDCNITKLGTECACNLECQNGGVVNCDCACVCPAGWGGGQCDRECKDYHQWCGNNWPAFACNYKNFGWMLRWHCPRLCGLCEPAPVNATPGPVTLEPCEFPTMAMTTTIPATTTVPTTSSPPTTTPTSTSTTQTPATTTTTTTTKTTETTTTLPSTATVGLTETDEDTSARPFTTSATHETHSTGGASLLSTDGTVVMTNLDLATSSPWRETSTTETEKADTPESEATEEASWLSRKWTIIISLLTADAALTLIAILIVLAICRRKHREEHRDKNIVARAHESPLATLDYSRPTSLTSQSMSDVHSVKEGQFRTSQPQHSASDSEEVEEKGDDYSDISETEQQTVDCTVDLIDIGMNPGETTSSKL